MVMGNVYMLQGRYTEAIPYYQEVTSLCEKHGYKHRQHTALLTMGACFVKLGKIESTEFNDCLKRKFLLELELKLKSEDEIYEI